VFNSEQDKWHLFGTCHFDMSLRFRKFCDAVSQELAQYVTWHNQNGQINGSLEELLPQVDEINREHVAAARNLNLYTDTNVSRPAVDRLTLDPIYAAAFLLSPSASLLELSVNHDANNLGAVRIPTLLNQKSERL